MSKDSKSRDGKWFADVLNSMSEFVLVKGARSKLLWANNAFLEYYGLTPESLQDIVDSEHSDPDDTLQYVRDDHEVFTTGKTLSVTEPITKFDGSVGYYDTLKTPLVNKDNVVVGTVGTSRPAESEMLVEASSAQRIDRKETADILRSVVTGIPLPIVVVDAKQRIIAESGGFETLIGHSCKSRRIEEVLSGSESLRDPIDNVIATGIEHRVSNFRMAKSNHLLDLFVQPWKLPSNETGGALITINDVTALDATQQELLHRNRQLENSNIANQQAALESDTQRGMLESVMEALSAGVIVVGSDGKILLSNKEASLLLGRDEQSPLSGLLHEYAVTFQNPDGTEVPEADLPLTQALDGGTVEGVVLRVRTKQAEVDKYLTVSAQPLLIRKTIRGASMVFMDISARMRDQRDLEEFAFVASHDLQEPIRMTKSYVDLFLSEYGDTLDENSKEYLGFVSEGASRMQRMVRGLLTFSQERYADLQLEEVDLGDVVEETLRNLKQKIPDSDTSIEYAGLPCVLVDPSSFGHVFSNLIGNAIKFRDPSRELRIKITAENLGTSTRISVADNGMGVAPEYATRIFGMFKRLHTHTAYPGSGIGLALCKRIVERHKGSIGVDSSRADGATFWFTLPQSTGESAPLRVGKQ